MGKTKNVTPHQKTQIMQKLFSSMNKKGRPELGTINKLANEFQLCRKTITRLWKEVQNQINNKTVINLGNKRIGREPSNKVQFDDEKFKAIKCEFKTTQHSVAKQIGVSQSTIFRWKKKKIIRKHTNPLKPAQIEKNKLHRYVAFYKSGTYEEELRRKGELETKPNQSIIKEHMRAMLINNVIPTISAKWPSILSKDIIIQQDNAKPHVAPNDKNFVDEATKDGFNIQLVQQPPNSPDMNVLDLGFFRSIQALQFQKAAYNIRQLLRTVNLAFENLNPQCLRFVFITLQACMIEIIKRKGGFDYHIPHMNKTKQARE
ncbi:uncharacterized protein LOC130796800 [Amaranthus tricolor]|uniref:uncharacterized protein LOC130796800 n=1 Tax=Amaranthus tricolor TaxID=29722 RepID=UPI00258C8DBC|nr:uncharacterized protein LOC130796800 [Amaranthus tricolor]